MKQAIGVVPQEIALYPSITARENLRFWGRMYGLGVEFNDADQDALLQTLGDTPGVRQVGGEDSALLLQVDDANTALASVGVTISQTGARIKQLEVREPNLEAVFLHLTGRALRD